MTPLSDSEHFHFEELAPGVIAALAKQDGLASSNSGIIDLGDQTLIFDSTQSPLAADELKKTAESLTGRQVDKLILSHGHADHWMGNQVFSDIEILATQATCKGFPDRAKEIETLIQNPLQLSDEIARLELALGEVADPIRKVELERSLHRNRAALAILPELKITPPNASFTGSLELKGSKLKAELVELPGHTDGDCVLILPSLKVAFIGDLGFFNTFPFMSWSNPEKWVTQIEFLESQELQLFCPGHGPLGTRNDLELEELYLLLVCRWVKDGLAANARLDSLKDLQLPVDFQAWGESSKRHSSNLEYLFRYYQATSHNN